MPEFTDCSGSVQDLLPLADIDRDVVQLRDGACRAVLETGSLGFALRSEAEREAILAGYRAFLNSLHFPLQILVRVQPADVEGYLAGLRSRSDAGNYLHPALARLALDHEAFVRRLAREHVLLDRRFYVVVPAGDDAPDGAALMPPVAWWPGRRRPPTPAQQAAVAVRQLAARCGQVTEGLVGLGLAVRRLAEEELAALWYAMLAPDRARLQSLPPAPALVARLRRAEGPEVSDGR